MAFSSPRILSFASVGRIAHGIGAMDMLPALLAERSAERTVIVSCRSVMDGTDLIGRAKDLLGERFVGLSDPIGAHTPAEAVAALQDLARDRGADSIVAIGGSSVTDGAKIASLQIAGGTPEVTLHDGVVTEARTSVPPGRHPALIAIPTTLSAGEYNGGGGMVEQGRGAKIMALDDRQLPWAVILDPLATLSTPWQLWASTGVKAIDHAAEAIWGTNSHIYGDALATAALVNLTEGLSATMADESDLDARLRCQLGAWLSVASMKNTGLHLSHIVEHNMGSYWHLPHGITSCVALPTVMRFLASETPDKVATVAQALGVEGNSKGDPAGFGERGAEHLRGLIGKMGLPTRLRDVLPAREGFEKVAEHSINELGFFGYVPAGGAATIEALLDQMW